VSLPATDSADTGSARKPALAGGFVAVTAANIIANLFSYLLLLVAARRLVAVEYSEVVTLLNVLLIGYIGQLALQTVVARRAALGDLAGVTSLTLGIGFVGGLIVIALTPALRAFLHLPGWTAVICVGVALPGIAVQGLCQGIWQGRENFHALAISTFTGIAGRSGAGLLGLLLGGTSATTMVCVAIGVSLSAAANFLFTPLRHARTRSHPHDRVPLLIEAAHASHAFGVFLLLTATDLLLARHSLPSAAAATYAAGSVITRGTLWLPQSIANVLFAKLTDASKHRAVFLRAIAVLGSIAAVVVLGSYLLSSFTMHVVAGDKYPDLRPDVWLFAGLGGSLAILQFVLVAGLAVRSITTTGLVWAAIAAEVITVLSLGHQVSVHRIIASVCVVNLSVAALAILVRIRGHANSVSGVVPVGPDPDADFHRYGQ